jgi:hypothetical protein
MYYKHAWVVALLALPAVTTPAGAQQPPSNSPAQTPQYYPPPGGYQPTPAAPAPQQQQPPPQQPGTYYPPAPPQGYAQPAPNYQPPPPARNQSPPSYQAPPNYTAPSSYQPPANYQAPPASYPPPAPPYQQATPGYQPQTGYQAPQSYQPPPGYQAAPANLPAPASQPAMSYAPQANQQMPRGAAEDQPAPYHVHRDRRNGHDHVYPDRGSVVHAPPHGALVVNYAGVSYRFHDGVWYEPRGPAFMVVTPPIGLLVQTLPAFASPVPSGMETLLYANEIYYRPRPDIGGYEVVNDPQEESAPSAETAEAPAATPLPAALPVATAATAAVPAAPLLPPTGMVPAAPIASAAPIAPAAPSVSTTLASAAAQPTVWVAAAPMKGQTPDQQARDRYDCYQFAVAQTGFDPLRASGGVPTDQAADRKAAYERAQSACFDGRGYSVR